jgi:DNA (cytosine-5)-methyltransferase 1
MELENRRKELYCVALMNNLGTPEFLNAVGQKLSRLRAGGCPQVVDLFAGCGGLSLGASAAGCDILGAVEIDPAASKSHGLNFHAGALVHSQARDISITEPSAFLNELGFGEFRQAEVVDILVGGPPCQAFARVGRAKLREVMDHPEAFMHDARSGLYRDYLRFVEELSPVAVVIENVPDVLNYGGLNIFETIASALDSIGYDCTYGLLNSAHYGVPQMRTRCFLIGIARVAEVSPELPQATHCHQLPSGYRGTRDVAVRALNGNFKDSRYCELPDPGSDLPGAVTAKDALGDLPKIKALNLLAKGKIKKGAQRFDRPIKMTRKSGISSFAEEMRSWPGFESNGQVVDHVIRFLPRDYKLFQRMSPGDQYPQAHELAIQMFEEELQRQKPKPRKGGERFETLRSNFVPPYDPKKFPNKWRKMEGDQPARTLMAHIGKDTYSHIHYDSTQARTISVREAARLQSFPDGFTFSGAMNSAFRQIGNAVPPLLAKAVVGQLLESLRVDISTMQCV